MLKYLTGTHKTVSKFNSSMSWLSDKESSNAHERREKEAYGPFQMGWQ